MQFGDAHYRDIPDILLAHIHQGIPQFDSVICGNDRIAFMVYQTLLAKGIRVPQDIGDIGDLPPLKTVPV